LPYAFQTLSVECFARSPALIPQRCRPDVILAIRCDQRQRGKPFDDPVAAFRPGKSLQQFLQHKAGSQNRLATFERLD
jgi:hypothetical protein